MEIDGVRRLCHRHKYIDENDNCTTALFKPNLRKFAPSLLVRLNISAICVRCSFFGGAFRLVLCDAQCTKNAFLHRACIFTNTRLQSRENIFYVVKRLMKKKILQKNTQTHTHTYKETETIMKIE